MENLSRCLVLNYAEVKALESFLMHRPQVSRERVEELGHARILDLAMDMKSFLSYIDEMDEKVYLHGDY